MRILIIGASGYLGNTIYKKLKEDSNNVVYGTCYKHKSTELLKINVLDKNDIEKIISLNVDIIIWSIFDKENEMPLSKIGLNEIINKISPRTRFIYISTTVGRGKDQTENVMPYKRNTDEYMYKYINGKIEGENIVKNHSNNVIIRPGSIYGFDYDGKRDCRMEKMLEIYKSNKKYSRTANMYTSFVNVINLCDAIIELINSDYVGIINISLEKAVSYYDFYKYLAKLMKIDDSFIVADYKENNMYHNLNNNKRKSILKSKIEEIL